jgi:rhodanese-related sulfurtransferase
MSTQSIKKEQELAIEYFEQKLAFETGPIAISRMIESGEKVQIIDLRTPELFAKSHIPGAINVSYDDLTSYADKLNPEVPTVVYCYDIVCHLATKAALLLAKKGYRVRELVGGYDEWVAKKLKAEGTAKAGGSCCNG